MLGGFYGWTPTTLAPPTTNLALQFIPFYALKRDTTFNQKASSERPLYFGWLGRAVD